MIRTSTFGRDWARSPAYKASRCTSDQTESCTRFQQLQYNISQTLNSLRYFKYYINISIYKYKKNIFIKNIYNIHVNFAIEGVKTNYANYIMLFCNLNCNSNFAGAVRNHQRYSSFQLRQLFVTGENISRSKLNRTVGEQCLRTPSISDHT